MLILCTDLIFGDFSVACLGRNIIKIEVKDSFQSDFKSVFARVFGCVRVCESARLHACVCVRAFASMCLRACVFACVFRA